MPETTTTTTTTDINIEHKLELGFMSILSDRDYFKSGGEGYEVLMLNFMDNSSDDRPAKYIVVHAAPAVRVAPNAPYYKISVKLVALTHMPSDKDRKLCKALYNENFNCIRGLDVSSLGTASGLTIDGVVMTQGDEAIEPIKDYQMMLASCDIFLTQN
jgi:hypothetical protein